MYYAITYLLHVGKLFCSKDLHQNFYKPWLSSCNAFMFVFCSKIICITGKVLPEILVSDFQNMEKAYTNADTPNPIYVHLS